MRFFSIPIALCAAVLLSACDFWPKDLEPLAESITERGVGDTTAWLLGGAVLVITVQNSPLFDQPQADFEASATEIAGQVIAFSPEPLESIVVTFHQREISDDPEKTNEYIFLVLENRPVLQPFPDLDATGPLTPDEFQTQFIERLGDALTREEKECILREAVRLADDAGDPATLDPAAISFLPVGDTWNILDPFGKRLILGQAITTQAMFTCAREISE